MTHETEDGRRAATRDCVKAPRVLLARCREEIAGVLEDRELVFGEEPAIDWQQRSLQRMRSLLAAIDRVLAS